VLSLFKYSLIPPCCLAYSIAAAAVCVCVCWRAPAVVLTQFYVQVRRWWFTAPHDEHGGCRLVEACRRPALANVSGPPSVSMTSTSVISWFEKIARRFALWRIEWEPRDHLSVNPVKLVKVGKWTGGLGKYIIEPFFFVAQPPEPGTRNGHTSYVWLDLRCQYCPPFRTPLDTAGYEVMGDISPPTPSSTHCPAKLPPSVLSIYCELSRLPLCLKNFWCLLQLPICKFVYYPHLHNPYTYYRSSVTHDQTIVTLLCPRPIAGALSYDARLTSVWRLSVAYIGPKSRTDRPRKTKIGAEVTTSRTAC